MSPEERHKRFLRENEDWNRRVDASLLRMRERMVRPFDGRPLWWRRWKSWKVER